MADDLHEPPRPDIARCPLDEVDSMDKAMLSGDPHPYFARLRREAPVYRDPRWGFWSVATYDLIQEVLRSPGTFSSDMSGQYETAISQMDAEELAILARGVPQVHTMLTADPPSHTRYKKLAMQAFTYKRVEQMGGYMARVTHSLIDWSIGAGRCEFKRAFADMLPSIVIADQFGVPHEDLGQFHIWLLAQIVRLSGTMSSKEARLEAAQRQLELQAYMLGKIAERRRRPSDDLISDLVHATLAAEGDARPLTDAELISIFTQIFVAGQETTAHTLTAGMFYLLTHPDQFERVKNDHALIPNFIDETLRFLTPVNNMWRTVARDTELGGVALRKGEMIFLRFGSGDRDETHFPDPDRYDVARSNANEHLAFGGGIHFCLGSQLARKEMNTAFPILFDRLKNPRLLDDPSMFRYNPNPLLRGVLELNIGFDPA
jgi:cytochrome P450